MKLLDETLPETVGTNSSLPVNNCQICGSNHLDTVLFLGYMPPVNHMHQIGSQLQEQQSYPTSLLHCRNCDLVQIGLIVDPKILFPSYYPYCSGTTQILHDNFNDLAEESSSFLNLKKNDLVIDIGSNDGTLLSKFKERGFRVLGIEPTDTGLLAREKGIDTIISYFNPEVVSKVMGEYPQAKIITAANVFAHIENIHQVISGIKKLLSPNGVFISESHYLISLIETMQYDTVYHEHLRYYSLNSLKHLLEANGLEIIKAKRIPTHGGSIRVYAAWKGTLPIDPTVSELLAQEAKANDLSSSLSSFAKKVAQSKLQLLSLLNRIKDEQKSICGISAPSRSSTLINYVGLDNGIIDFVVEINGSLKIGKYLPGTIIPILNQDDVMFGDNQPDYALILSWHIAKELVAKLKNKGYKGKFIVPLPEPYIID